MIKNIVSIDDMQFCFLVQRNMTHKDLMQKKTSYILPFVDTRKASSDQVLCKVIWWSMRKLDILEWLVKIV